MSSIKAQGKDLMAFLMSGKHLKEFLSEFDPRIAKIEVVHGANRIGDIPHSLANIDKAKTLLNYNPQFSMYTGLKEAVKWYWENLK